MTIISETSCKIACYALLAKGLNVDAIKLTRACLGMDLGEAKRWVEHLALTAPVRDDEVSG